MSRSISVKMTTPQKKTPVEITSIRDWRSMAAGFPFLAVQEMESELLTSVQQ
jgi:hypothetical protein